MSFSVTLHLIPLRQGLSGNTKFSLSVGELGWPASSCLCLLTLGLQAACGCVFLFCRCWGFQLRVSFLYTKCSYPWVTLPAPTFSFLTLPLSMEIVPPRILV